MDTSVQSPTIQEPVSTITSSSGKKKQSVTKILIILVLTIITLGIGFSGGYFVASQKTSKAPMKPVIQTTPTVKSIGSICPDYGVLDPSQFLTAYTVKSGDTLASIADKQLNDTNRANELLLLNSHYDSSFTSSAGAQLTPDISIYLPPKEVKNTSGFLVGIGGMYVRSEDHYFWLRTRTENSENGDTPIILNVHTQVAKDIKPGDCVIAISDSNSHPQTDQTLLVKKAQKTQ